MTATGCTVLVVEDDIDFLFITDAHLSSFGHRVVGVHSVHEALDHLSHRQGEFDVVLLDLGLPDISGLDGLRATTDATGTPVVVYTADPRASLRRAAGELGATSVLVKGETNAEVLDHAIRSAASLGSPIRSAPFGGPAVFTAYDGPEPAIRDACEVLSMTTGFDRWAFVRPVASVQVVLVRIGAGDELASGDQVNWLVEIPSAADVLDGVETISAPLAETKAGVVQVGRAVLAPVELEPGVHGTLVGWSADTELHTTDAARRSIAHAARDIATFHELGRQRDGALRRADIAGNAASVDALTKLGNRRAFDAYLRAEEDRCVRHEHGGTVFVIDLDRLKQINDTDGHGAGDRYLRTAAIALNEAMRPTDVVFRIGGDEYATVAVRSDSADAEGIAARMREQLDAHGVDASIGWASRPPEATLLQAFAAADEAMYRQKVERRAAREADTGVGSPTGSS